MHRSERLANSLRICKFFFPLDNPFPYRYFRGMNRRAMLQLFTGGLSLAGAGCLTDLWSTKSHEAKVPPDHVENSRRVDELTKRIVDQNTFTGLEPIVTVLGFPEAALFHRGTNQLFISDGMVKKCKTDAELAAVLCSELGQMMAQKRAVIAVGRNKDPIPEIALPGGVNDSSGVRIAELALQQKRIDEKRNRDESDAVQKAKDLLKGAGFDPAEFDRVEGMIRQSDRGEAIKKQMAGTAHPTWNQ